MKKSCDRKLRLDKEVGRPLKIKLMMVREGPKESCYIDSPEAVFEFMQDKASRLDREHFWRIDLDARSHIIGYEVISIGTLIASPCHPREVFKGALLNNAVSIIIAHNHPSGKVDPSIEDREVTKRLKQAGELLGIPLQDHLVLADNAYFSFRERGLI